MHILIDSVVRNMNNSTIKPFEVSDETETIQYKSLGIITAEKIRDAIIEGRFEPGTRITESEIAEKYGVSRVVIREAFSSLTQEGLLVKERNKYTQIVEFSQKDIKEIFDLRIAIEVAAASICVEDSIDIIDELKEKSNIIDKMRNAKKDSLIDKLVRSDLDFHEFILMKSGNQRMLDVWNSLSSQILVLLYKYIINQQEKLEDNSILHDHSDIIEAFEKKNVAVLQKVLSKHINDTKLFLENNY
jgi:DNA-binding GntR family transcriptional regulator